MLNAELLLLVELETHPSVTLKLLVLSTAIIKRKSQTFTLTLFPNFQFLFRAEYMRKNCVE